MKLLITGGSGFIGRNVLLALPKDWETTATYYRSVDFIDFLKKNSLNNVIPLQLDLRSNDEIKKIQKLSSSFDACIFLSANGDPAVSIVKPVYDLESNTLTLLNLISNITFDKFIYFSSGAVYDGLKGAVSPASFVCPKLPYAISNLTSEYYLKHFKEKGRINDLIVVRFFGAYGPYEPPRKIYSRLVRQFAIDKDPHFTIYGDGNNLIDAMCIDDAVLAIFQLLEYKTGDVTVDLYPGQPYTLTQLVEKVAQVFNIKAEISYKKDVAEYIEFFSNDRLMFDSLGFSCSIPIEKGLLKLYSYLKNTPEHQSVFS